MAVECDFVLESILLWYAELELDAIKVPSVYLVAQLDGCQPVVLANSTLSQQWHVSLEESACHCVPIGFVCLCETRVLLNRLRCYEGGC